MRDSNGVDRSLAWLAEHAHDYVLPDGFRLGVSPECGAQAEDVTKQWTQVLARMLQDYRCA